MSVRPRAVLQVLGVTMFDRLRRVAVRHDERLRAQLSSDELEQLADTLDRLRGAVEAPVAASNGG
ncbi:MAG: hypothetical protein ACM3UV_07170 [Nocardioidaceae bacterium]